MESGKCSLVKTSILVSMLSIYSIKCGWSRKN
jgi:hypothetical protein